MYCFLSIVVCLLPPAPCVLSSGGWQVTTSVKCSSFNIKTLRRVPGVCRNEVVSTLRRGPPTTLNPKLLIVFQLTLYAGVRFQQIGWSAKVPFVFRVVSMVRRVT